MTKNSFVAEVTFPRHFHNRKFLLEKVRKIEHVKYQYPLLMSIFRYDQVSLIRLFGIRR